MSRACMPVWCEKFSLTNNEMVGIGPPVVIDVSFFALYELGVQILSMRGSL